MTQPDDSQPQSKPTIARKAVHNMHHTAFRCRDAEQTRWFYEDVLGFKLAAAMVFDEEPGAAKQLANAVSERVWGLAVAPDGEEYYYHLATNATAWSLPAGAILQADGDTYVSEQQHRISPKVSPKISPKAKASPKARVAATSGSPKSPKSRIDAAAATPPQKPPTKPHTEADAGDEPPDAAEAKAMEEEEEAAQEEEAEEHTSVQASRMRTLLASVQEQLQQSEMRRAESAAELQV